MSRIIQRAVVEVLRCPHCKVQLTPGDRFLCCGCGETFEVLPSGQVDLRPRRSWTGFVPFSLSPDPPDTEARARLLREIVAKTKERLLSYRHLSPEMISLIPVAEAKGKVALDLGCGNGNHRTLLEDRGFHYLGIDYSGVGADVLGDAHALPLESGSIDFVLSVAVLSHLAHPFVALREAWRVLRPGCSFIGTAAFLEPFNNTFFHFSHQGLLSALTQAGFSVRVIAPNEDWTVLKAQAKWALFPGLPLTMRYLLVSPVQLLHRLVWKIISYRAERRTELNRLLTTTGSYFFIADKLVEGREPTQPLTECPRLIPTR